MVGTVGKAHELQQFGGTLLSGFLGCPGNVGGNHDILYCGKLRQQLVELEYEADVAVAEVGELLLRKGGGVDAIDTYRAAVGAVEGADNLE